MSTRVPGRTTRDSPWRSLSGREPGIRTTVPLVDRRSVTTTDAPSWRSSRWVPDTSLSGDGHPHQAREDRAGNARGGRMPADQRGHVERDRRPVADAGSRRRECATAVGCAAARTASRDAAADARRAPEPSWVRGPELTAGAGSARVGGCGTRRCFVDVHRIDAVFADQVVWPWAAALAATFWGSCGTGA